MRSAPLLVAILGAVTVATSVAAPDLEAGEGLVSKVAEPFDSVPWAVDPWGQAKGTTSLSPSVAPDTGSTTCLEINVEFPGGRGFQWFAAHPRTPLVIPGELKSVRVRAQSSDPRCVFVLKLKDGWNREQAGGRKLETALGCKTANEWTTVDFTVPADWVQPVTVDGVLVHNWDFQGEARKVRLRLDRLEATTDISRVDPETGVLGTWRPNADEKDPKKLVREAPKTPLVSADISTGAISNVFAGAEPSVSVAIRNWKPGALAGTLRCVVQDLDGKGVLEQAAPVSAESAAHLAFPLKVDRFGLYTLAATLTLPDGATRTKRMAFARLPEPRALDETRKRASPYGLNVHGGSETMELAPFRDAGLVWFRDYAFTWEWVLRAKGADKRYAGWPNYPALVGRYDALGLKLLPCLQGSIRPPDPQNGQAKPAGPDRAWAMEIADLLSAFPRITHWELSNEYDLKAAHAAAEEAIQWSNYRAYHRKFAEVLGVLGGGELTAVENGRAGIWPERARACVASGDFAGVGVVNVHHYCGVEPPDVNYGNFNTGFETIHRDEAPALFFDRLRSAKRAAVADGKARELWLTEFGWDTLAGNVVTPYEQAAFLPRAWLLALAAGTDKCFWFYNYDAAQPRQFFDGCGLLAADGSPKLSLCALAGLTSLLPTPRFVGEINAGENTGGVVFESDGRLVAALWTLQGDAGPEVAVQAERLCDFLGNARPGRAARLRLAPTYAVGLAKDDPLYRQTAYRLETPYLSVATAGDAVTPVLLVSNNRAAALQGTVTMTLPAGWRAAQQSFPVQAAPGETKRVPLPFTVAAAEGLGQKVVRFTVAEEGPVKEIGLQILVQPPLILQVGPIQGPPGRAEITVKVGNQSAQPVNGTLRLRLPAAWKAITSEQAIEGLKPGEIRTAICSFEWNTDWKAGESAQAVFAAADGKSVQRPIIPRSYRIHRAPALTLDGKLDDWPAACELPAWILGSTLGEAKARVFLAWSPEGLYGAVEAHDSNLSTADPRSFWAGDVLELFLDTSDDKRPREYEAGDHQFWLVPLANESRVYAGRWKRKSEIPETLYDLPGMKGAAVRLADGYAMEFLLPAAALQKYQPKPGGRLGVSLNLSVKGLRFAREVYWPWTKSDGTTASRPGTWGSLEMVE